MKGYPRLKYRPCFASIIVCPCMLAITWLTQMMAQESNVPGDLLWTYNLGIESHTSPAIDGQGRIYLGANDGLLYAFQSDGTLDWTFQIGTRLTASPVVGNDGTVYIGSLSPANRLYAVHPDGTLYWRYDAGVPVENPPAVGQQNQIYLPTTGRMTALDSSGKPVWVFELPDQDVPTTPSIGHDGTIYFGSISNVVALNPDGSQKWTFTLQDRATSITLERQDRMYVGSFDNEGHLYALDTSGRQIWSLSLGASIEVPPVIHQDGTLFVSTLNDTLFAIGRNGDRLWEYRPGPVRGSFPAMVRGGSLLFGAMSGDVVALSTDGSDLWTRPGSLSSSGFGSPTLNQQGVMFLVQDSVLMAIQAAPLARSSWPMAYGNPQHTSSIELPFNIPTPSLIHPENATVYLPSLPLNLEARIIGDEDEVVEVQFLNGDTLIGSVSAPPWQFDWVSPPSGRHSIRVVSVNHSGLNGVSGVVDILINHTPNIQLKRDAEQEVVRVGDVIRLHAEASDPDGTVEQVVYYQDDEIIEIQEQPPFFIDRTISQPRQYLFHARAVDDLGGVTDSNTISVIGDSAPLANLTLSPPGQSYYEGDPVLFNVSAEDLEEEVVRVDFYNGWTFLGSDFTEPYSVTLANLTRGDHVIMARAVDPHGEGPISNPVRIRIQARNYPPTIHFFEPFENAIIHVAEKVKLVYEITDPEEDVETIDLFVDGLHETDVDRSGLIEHSLTSITPGRHTVRVEVVDSSGNSVSKTMTFTAQSLNSPLPDLKRPQTRPRKHFPATDGRVHTVVESEGRVFLGGTFTRLGYPVGQYAMLSFSDGPAHFDLPELDGPVHAILEDGTKGYYIGGSFTHVNGVPRSGIARLHPDHSVDLDFKADTSEGHVLALAMSDSTLFAGGEFTQINGQQSRYAAALDKNSGKVLPWQPEPNRYVTTIEVVGETVYMGGAFSALGHEDVNVGPPTHKFFAAVDVKTGAVSDWIPGLDDEIMDIQVAGDRLYLSGRFRHVNGVDRDGFAAFDISSQSLLPLMLPRPIAGGRLAIEDSILYASGGNEVVAVDLESDGESRWQVSMDGPTDLLLVYDNALYVTGGFRNAGGLPRRFFAALDRFTGEVSPFTLEITGRLQAMEKVGNQFLGVGSLGLTQSKERRWLAAVDGNTGEILDWNPSVEAGSNGQIHSLLAVDGLLVVAGIFSGLDGKEFHGVGALDMQTGRAAPWNLRFASGVKVLAAARDRIFLGGSFTSINEQQRHHLAALDKISGNLLPWNPHTDGDIDTILVKDDKVYVGGHFQTVGGIHRPYLALLNLFTGEVMDWGPDLDGRVTDLVMSDSVLYVCGQFNHADGLPRSRMVALDLETGKPTGWKVDLEESPLSMGLAQTALFLGGQFNVINGHRRINNALLDTRLGFRTMPDWSVETDSAFSSSIVHHVHLNDLTLYLAGQFDQVNGQYRPNLAAFDYTYSISNPSQPTDNRFQFEWTEPVGWPFVFEVSKDLEHWSSFQTHAAPAVIDYPLIPGDSSFFRARPLR